MIIIKTTSQTDLAQMWEIYVNAFPSDERRTREQQEALQSQLNYTILCAKEEDEVLGFLTQWSLVPLPSLEPLRTLVRS